MCQASDALRQAGEPPAGAAAASQPPGPSGRGGAGRRRTDAATRLVLLGTAGGSNPKAHRCGFANAVVVGGAAYVVDCGEGVHRQLWRAGIAMHHGRTPAGGATVEAIFLTHLHSDHVIDLANLVLGFWPAHRVGIFGPGPAGLPIPHAGDGPTVALFNPEEPTPGTAALLRHLLAAHAYNINVRIVGEGRADMSRLLDVREIGVQRDGHRPDIDLAVAAAPAEPAPKMEPVVVYPEDERGVQVSAVLVSHPPVFPALAYRFDTPAGSVVFSGDTGTCDNLARLAAGADVLVHEVMDLAWMERRLQSLPNRAEVLGHLARAHSSAADAGACATHAGVGTLVLSHLVPGDGEITDEDWEGMVRPHFDGTVVCGGDLDELPLAR